MHSVTPIKDKRGTLWSADESDLLRQLWNADFSVKVIAKSFPNRTIKAIKKKVLRLELKARRTCDKWFHPAFSCCESLANKIVRNAHDLGITQAEYMRRCVDRCPIDLVDLP